MRSYRAYRNKKTGVLLGSNRFYSMYPYLELVNVMVQADGSKTVVPVDSASETAIPVPSDAPDPNAPEGLPIPTPKKRAPARGSRATRSTRKR